MASSTREINATLLTLGAGGDVVRNLMAPLGANPRTRTYHEIWLDGERLPAEAAEDAHTARECRIDQRQPLLLTPSRTYA